MTDHNFVMSSSPRSAPPADTAGGDGLVRAPRSGPKATRLARDDEPEHDTVIVAW